MLALTAHLFFATLPACAADARQVPLALQGFSADDERWLVGEFGRWFQTQERDGCLGPGGLLLVQDGLGAWVRYVEQGEQFERRVDVDPSDTELFRYQVSAAGEELLRARWEAPPEPRWAMSAGAQVLALTSGPLYVGPTLHASLAVTPATRIEFGLRFAPLLSGGISGLTSWLANLDVSAAWLPLRPGVFRAGLGAGAEVGLLSLRIEGGLPPLTQATPPWLATHAGLRTGIEWKRLVVSALGEVGFAFFGANALEEGQLVRRLAGLYVQVALRVGFRW
jgi:hypothetical protein